MRYDELKTEQTICGYHHYYMIGVMEARERVQEACPPGYRASWARKYEEAREGDIRVGQVRVRSGDPQFVLYVRKAEG